MPPTDPDALSADAAEIMERVMPPRAAAALEARARLPVDSKKSIAVKRDVHEFLVEADAASFARAFAEVMTDPAGRFGLIRVKRPAARMGRDFVRGERFQGCYSVGAAVLVALARRPRARRLATRLLTTPLLRWGLARLEDAMLSDYAVIDELVLDPDPDKGEIHSLRYAYLDGTPIAGSSRFCITPLGPARCRVEQVFEYQEVNGLALASFQRFGLKLHDQVVHRQVSLAAARAGAPAPRGTIPAEYVAA